MSARRPADTYKDLLVILLGFLVLFLITGKQVLLYIALAVALSGSLSDTLAERISWAWWKLAHGMGFIASRILLSALYFLFLTPLAWLYRFFKKDPLQLKRTSSESYYTPRQHQYNPRDLEKMW
ncbi:MAG: hypothetical protein KatS3mg031_2184 [Chitinophagales bacterium]|nr:MAG: hypothetical protein KatS3mg031_2184 [Chitinophagales bacterium]